MKTYLTNQIKNLVLLGNAGSGKSTLAESMLFEGGIIDRRGDIASKNTVSDYNLIEHENESSIFSTVLYTEYNDKKINFIDVPGSDDFVGGTVAGLHIADTALMLINAQNGIEVGTEIHNRWVEHFEKPMVIVINHLDHDKANYDKALEMLKERFRGKIATVQYPVNAGPGFDSIVDLIKMKFYKYPVDGGKPQILDIPDSETERANELKAELIEKAAENDESLMELFFEKETLTEDEMRKGIHAGLLNHGMFPVFCVSGKKNIGVGRLMEFLVNVAPTPDQVPAPKDKSGKEIKCDAKGPASVFVFKTTIESHIGEVNYFKVMSGEITESMDLINSRTSNKERLSQIFSSAGKNRVKLPKMVAGDIGSTVKLKATKNNDTLSANGEIAFENVPYPAPKFRTAIKAVSESDDEKLGEALSRLHEEDPTLIIEYSKELKQIILHGQGEYHLNIVKWHLDHVFKIDTEYLTPKIPYRETITKSAQADYRHKKQSGGSGQFGEVHMLIEPFIEGAIEPATFKANGKEMKLSLRGKEEHELPWGGKLVYYNCIVGGSIDARFMPAILKGIMEKLETGPLTGSYARDIRVFVYDGKMHPVDSNEISFRLAGRNAFSQAFKIAGPKILEPIYLVEVLVPGDRMGDVMSDLQGRRAIVQGMTSERGFEKITAKVPLAEMNKYSTALSSITSGRAMYSMKYLEYAQVPGDVQVVACLDAIGPDLWILDEALGELDYEWKDRVLDVIAGAGASMLLMESRWSEPSAGRGTVFSLLRGGRIAAKTKDRREPSFREALAASGILPGRKREPRSGATPGFLRAEALDFRFGESGAFGLRLESLELRFGETCALVGRNGSGKSTLGRILCGLLRPREGSIGFGGEHGFDRARPEELCTRVGYLFQNPDHQIYLPTVREELALGLRRRRLERRDIEERVQEAASIFSLAELSAPPALLSYGARRRLQAATFFLLSRDVLILDEIDSGLSYREVESLVDALASRGPAIVLITHDMTLAKVMCARVLVMEAGRITADVRSDRIDAVGAVMGREVAP